MYKPGQIVTINKVKYRIKKCIFGCACCNYTGLEPFQYPCRKCPVVTTSYCRRIKLVEICISQDNS